MRKFFVLLCGVLALSGLFTACQQSGNPTQADETSKESLVDIDDQMAEAINIYLHDSLHSDLLYDAYIPLLNIVDVEKTDEGWNVWGDFWVYYYNQKGDTSMKLETIHNYSGVIKLNQLPDGTYKVVDIITVARGPEGETYARRVFGERYEKFHEMVSNPAYFDSNLSKKANGKVYKIK